MNDDALNGIVMTQILILNAMITYSSTVCCDIIIIVHACTFRFTILEFDDIVHHAAPSYVNMMYSNFTRCSPQNTCNTSVAWGQ